MGNRANNGKLMYLFLPDTGKVIKKFRDILEQLILENNDRDHEHLNDSDYQREITVALYKPDDCHMFDERTQQLIMED